MVFVEVKAINGSLSDEQIEVHTALRERGFVVIVSRTVEDLRLKLAALLR